MVFMFILAISSHILYILYILSFSVPVSEEMLLTAFVTFRYLSHDVSPACLSLSLCLSLSARLAQLWNWLNAGTDSTLELAQLWK